jgi:hypothetical protein
MASGLGNTDFRWVTTPEYIDFNNEELLVIVQIETAEAVANLEALVGVPGVDLFFIGPEDLSIALGLPGQHPEYVVGRWWEQLLHNQTALRLKTRLLFTPGVMMTSVPYQLQSSQIGEERARRQDEQVQSGRTFRSWAGDDADRDHP